MCKILEMATNLNIDDKLIAKADILVVPFESAPKDGRGYWLGEAVALLLADDINARGLGAITRPI